jgi:hypothetical protein
MIATGRVHVAHADAWEVEGRARADRGGGATRVHGARLMASGLPEPRWNNADVSASDVDVEALSTWYRDLAVPWGIRVPLELAVDLGTPLFVKRCFGSRAEELVLDEQDDRALAREGLSVRRIGPAEWSRFVAAEAEVFGDPVALIERWVEPVLGRPGFAHWLAERDGHAVGTVTTVASDGEAGPAVMVTGLGVTPGVEGSVASRLVSRAITVACADRADVLVHVHGDPDDDVELYLALGFTEVGGLEVRLVVA